MAKQQRIRRINTEVGRDKLIKVQLEQDFDLMEILSLKFSQVQAYTSFCADYGVVCGRIIVNNGLGVPNAKVSIFIPIKDKDVDDPVISTLYPYTQVTDKDENNYRYNLLPARQQHGGHTPTGTFFDQNDILTREEVLEVFEDYYSYTVKTNNAGDFMIWGVPLGTQTLHIDLDLSDMGCFSLRPYDFIRQGKGVDNFKNKYTFKASNDLDSLPQIVHFDKTIEVYPFWGNQDFCEIGITRTDFDLSSVGVKIQPKAFLIGGTFTDVHKNSVNKNCTPRKKMGRKCDLKTKSGKIEALRYTPQKDELNRPYIEEVDVHEDIPDDGSFVLPLDMNMDYLFTNEFGENEITNDPNKGVPTSACYRLRFNMNDAGMDRVRAIGEYLVPNIREYVYDVDKSYAFDTEWSGYPQNALSLMLNNVDGEFYPQDYFYRFTYNKVYTVSSFHSHYVGENAIGTVGYANINEAHPAEEEDCGDKLTPPTNYGVKNYTFTLLVADILLVVDFLFKWITLMFLNILVFTLDGVSEWLVSKFSWRGLREPIDKIQIQNTAKLSLITYPECVECSEEAQIAGNPNTSTSPCTVATFTVSGSTNNSLLISGFATYTDSGLCSSTATPVISLADLFSRQTSYAIYVNNVEYLFNPSDPNSDSISGSTVSGSTTYYLIENNLLFSDPTQIYTIDVVDPNSKSNNDINIVQSGGCSWYNRVYDTSVIHGFYVATSNPPIPSPTQCGGVDPYTTVITPTGTPSRIYKQTISPGDIIVGTAIYGSSNYSPYNEISDVRRIGCERFNLGLPNGNGMSEFRDGVYYIVPGTQSSSRLSNVINEYYRRKRVGKMFCGGIVNYGFIDNWLSGSLYFPQIKIKNIQNAINSLSEGIARYCRDLTRLVVNQGKLYYRSAVFNGSTFTKIIRPTTFVDLGPRDEFIKQICTDPGLDVNCSVSRSIGATTYQDLGEILGLAINYRMETAGTNGNLNMFFQNTGFTWATNINTSVLDGDILQVLSENNEAGIEGFDLENPKYVGYQFDVLDPEEYIEFFTVDHSSDPSNFGPLPLTLELIEDGYRIRTCLNEPSHYDFHGNFVEGRLTESSQPVPFYLWDKKGTGFGPAGANRNNQSWDYSSIEIQPLQGMTYDYNITGVPNNDSDQYALLPITNDYSGLTITGINLTNQVEFETISNLDKTSDLDDEYPGYTYLWVTGGTVNGVKALGAHNNDTVASGVLYIRYGSAGNWETIQWNQDIDAIFPTRFDYYSGNKQILSTPFQFYFGLTAGKTGLDKFIDLFGPKGAFPYNQ
jgi:hypothetical protein